MLQCSDPHRPAGLLWRSSLAPSLKHITRGRTRTFLSLDNTHVLIIIAIKYWALTQNLLYNDSYSHFTDERSAAQVTGNGGSRTESSWWSGSTALTLTPPPHCFSCSLKNNGRHSHKHAACQALLHILSVQNSFTPHSNLDIETITIPIDRGENWSTRRFSDLAKVTQPGMEEPMFDPSWFSPMSLLLTTDFSV